MEKSHSRATFGGRISAVLVTAGSAVGLGNIWRFPYVAGDNGGGAFLLVYAGCILLLGLPLTIAEFAIGKSTRCNAVGAYRRLAPRWSIIGYTGILTSTLILGFYFVVAGWTAEYMLHSLTGEIAARGEAESHRLLFERFIADPWRPALYAVAFAVATQLVISLGVRRGIERAAKVMMPLLFLALLALAVHSILLPGGLEGLRFFLAPDFSKLTASSVLTALGQAFFSLSIGLGTMVTYASYFTPSTDIRRTAWQVTAVDTLVALLAGLVIFPAVFSAGIEPDSGPSLVFITLPTIFGTLPLGGLWSAIFFLLLVIAALTSTISLHEACTAYLHEEWRLPRRTAACCTTLVTVLLGIFASLSFGVLNGWRIGSLTLFDALDHLTADLLLPLGGLMTCLFAGWHRHPKALYETLYRDPRLGIGDRTLRFLLRYVCPAVMVLLFLDSLGIG